MVNKQWADWLLSLLLILCPYLCIDNFLECLSSHLIKKYLATKFQYSPWQERGFLHRISNRPQRWGLEPHQLRVEINRWQVRMGLFWSRPDVHTWVGYDKNRHASFHSSHQHTGMGMLALLVWQAICGNQMS